MGQPHCAIAATLSTLQEANMLLATSTDKGYGDNSGLFKCPINSDLYLLEELGLV